ncbi:hypothetical protein OLX02_01350 [Novosphingobium sp. KCTC 2891]|uniref:hypothetical protein n=1 Tax=Novosphingobium sp. KCTC 2891 TaxID=2989730 RepID=UPI0022220A5B|nr:hypothetical protein [Novosphingobium sp. KCTC 2891]MCW1381459.1 hypothetical protein [Novosphingobium sp. KCTC 2891]
MTDGELTEILRRELLPGERLLWQARPDPARLRKVFAVWLFAVPWTAFALFWEGMTLLPWLAETRTPDGIRWTFGLLFPLFGLPFVAVGAGLLAVPVIALRKATRTIFGLTDRRILRLTAGRQREAKSVMIDQMGPVDVRAGADGWGTLRIETGSHVDTDGDRVTERFEVGGVPDVSRLEGLLLELRRSGRDRA